MTGGRAYPRLRFNLSSNQRAVSLIEFLVVLVIIAIGLLSVAGMLAYGIKLDFQTSYRTIAVAQAKSLAERMHANLLGAVSGFYSDTPPAASSGNPPVSACPTGTSSARCTTARDLALADRAAWKIDFESALPPGSYASVQPLTSGVYSIVIGWPEAQPRYGAVSTVIPSQTLSGQTVTTCPNSAPTGQVARCIVFRYQTIPQVFAR